MGGEKLMGAGEKIRRQRAVMSADNASTDLVTGQVTEGDILCTTES